MKQIFLLTIYSLGVTLFLIAGINFQVDIIASLVLLKILFDSVVFPFIITNQALKKRTKEIFLTSILQIGVSAINFFILWGYGLLNFHDGESKIITQLLLRIWIIVQGINTIMYLVFSKKNSK